MLLFSLAVALDDQTQPEGLLCALLSPLSSSMERPLPFHRLAQVELSLATYPGYLAVRGYLAASGYSLLEQDDNAEPAYVLLLAQLARRAQQDSAYQEARDAFAGEVFSKALEGTRKRLPRASINFLPGLRS